MMDFRVSTSCLGVDGHLYSALVEIEYLPLNSQALSLFEQRPTRLFRQLELCLGVVTMLSYVRHNFLQVIQFLGVEKK